MMSASPYHHQQLDDDDDVEGDAKPAHLEGSVTSPLNANASSQPPLQFTNQSLALVIHSFLSFVICSLDRINMSVAIIAMSAEYGWNASTQGLIQSIFFLGYMLTMIPGGRLADDIGGRKILSAGVLIWSICTACIPLSTSHSTIVFLLAVRVCLGAGEGVAMPSMNAIVSRNVPLQYRARSLAFIYSGMYVGTIVGLLVTPWLLKVYGWQSAFYVYAAVGIVWVAIFLSTTTERETHPLRQLQRQQQRLGVTDTQLVKLEQITQHNQVFAISSSKHAHTTAVSDASPSSSTTTYHNAVTGSIESTAATTNTAPTLCELLSTLPVWAIIVGHFCCTWGYFVLVAWLPTYLYTKYKLNISESSLLSTLPWLSMFLFSNVGGLLADHLLATGKYEVTTIRKLNQAIGFAGPTFFLSLLTTTSNVVPAVVYIAAALATSAFSQSGVYANHADIGPTIAGTLLGLSNTFASIPGFVGVWISGVVFQLTGDWNYVFAIAIFFYAFGLFFYTTFATSKRIW